MTKPEAADDAEPIQSIDTVQSQSSDTTGEDGISDPSRVQRRRYWQIAVLSVILMVGVVVVSVLLGGPKGSDASDNTSSSTNQSSSSDVSVLGATNNETDVSSPTLVPTLSPMRKPSPVATPVVVPVASPPVPSPVAPASSSFQPVLLNAGGFLYTDADGNVWHSDEPFRTTGRNYNDTCPPQDGSSMTPIDRTLYCTGRVHVEGYEIPVPSNAMYAVLLHFYYGNSTTPPVLDLYLEGQLVLTDPGNRDLFVLQVDSVNVTDGSLSISFVKETGSVRISALEVHWTALLDSNNSTMDTPSNTTGSNVTYAPGLLVTEMEGLLLSQGLTARIIATSGQKVQYHDGSQSSLVFHDKPDAAATFMDERPNNPGGWIYVTNSEADLNTTFPGGVGAITFDRNGNVMDYQSILEGGKDGSWANCGGGKSPWGSWISGEEKRQGRIFQVDPTGERLGEPITMGNVHTGRFESFAYDIRNMDVPRFFMTKDDLNGELRRL